MNTPYLAPEHGGRRESDLITSLREQIAHKEWQCHQVLHTVKALKERIKELEALKCEH